MPHSGSVIAAVRLLAFALSASGARMTAAEKAALS